MENTKRNWKPIVIIVLFMIGNAIIDFVVCDEPLFFSLHLWCLIPYFCLIMYVATKSSLNIIYWILGDIVYCFLGSIKYLSIGEAALETMILWTICVFIFQVVVLLTIMIIRKKMSPLKIKETKKSIIIIVLFMVAKGFVDFIVSPYISYGLDMLGVSNYECFTIIYIVIFVYFVACVSRKSTYNFLIWLLGDIVSVIVFVMCIYVLSYTRSFIAYGFFNVRMLDIPSKYDFGAEKSIILPLSEAGPFGALRSGLMQLFWFVLIPVIQAITLLIATIVRKKQAKEKAKYEHPQD